MNIKLVIRAISAILVVIALAIASSALVAWLMGDSMSVVGTLASCATCTLATAVVGLLIAGKAGHFRFREGFAIVTFGWIIASAFGALPFIFIGGLHWYDAFFETMSGFTTTGASVLDSSLQLMNGEILPNGIVDMPSGLLFWRSLTHWLGGMGIVVLSLAVLPSLGLGAHQLFLAEVPGPTEDQLTPRIADSAKILWAVYILFSIVETALLMFGGMSLFDAWCHTCGTMATGGFSTSQASVAGFDSAYIDYVISLFMFLAGANFVLHFRALRGKPLNYWRDEEFRFYLAVTVVATIIIALYLMGGSITTTAGKVINEVGIADAFRYSLFQVTSILTTTGFATADFNLWPVACTLLLVLLMFIGGCAGSTGGGMKNSRIILVIKYSISQVERCFFRRSISNVRLSGNRVREDVLHKVMTFVCIFVGLFVLFSFLLCLCGVDDITTACTASIAALGNIGPGLEGVGPTQSYSWMTAPAKMILSLAMLLGRLELYTVLVLFIPSFYK